eukprot:g16015.t1
MLEYRGALTLKEPAKEQQQPEPPAGNAPAGNGKCSGSKIRPHFAFPAKLHGDIEKFHADYIRHLNRVFSTSSRGSAGGAPAASQKGKPKKGKGNMGGRGAGPPDHFSLVFDEIVENITDAEVYLKAARAPSGFSGSSNRVVGLGSRGGPRGGGRGGQTSKSKSSSQAHQHLQQRSPSKIWCLLLHLYEKIQPTKEQVRELLGCWGMSPFCKVVGILYARLVYSFEEFWDEVVLGRRSGAVDPNTVFPEKSLLFDLTPFDPEVKQLRKNSSGSSSDEDSDSDSDSDDTEITIGEFLEEILFQSCLLAGGNRSTANGDLDEDDCKYAKILPKWDLQTRRKVLPKLLEVKHVRRRLTMNAQILEEEFQFSAGTPQRKRPLHLCVGFSLARGGNNNNYEEGELVAEKGGKGSSCSDDLGNKLEQEQLKLCTKTIRSDGEDAKQQLHDEGILKIVDVTGKMKEPLAPSTGELSAATGPRFEFGCDREQWVRLAADHFTVTEPMVDEETGYLTLLVSPKKLTPEARAALFSPGAESSSSSFSCARTADSCVQWAGEVDMEKQETVAVDVLLGLVVVEKAEQKLPSLLLHNAEHHQEVENKPAVAELDFLSDDEPEEVGGCFIYDWSRSKGYSAADYERKASWLLKQDAVAGGGYGRGGSSGSIPMLLRPSKNKRKSDEQRDDAAGLIVDEENRNKLEEEKQKEERRMQNEAVRAKYGRGSPKRRKGADNGARGKEDFDFF